MGPKWLPNLALLRAKGQLVKSRIRNEMDGVRNKDQEPRWRRENTNLIESQLVDYVMLPDITVENVCKKCPQPCGASTSSHVPH